MAAHDGRVAILAICQRILVEYLTYGGADKVQKHILG